MSAKVKQLHFIGGRSLIAAAAIVGGLVVVSGGLATANSEKPQATDVVGPLSMQIGPVKSEAVIMPADHPDAFARADKARDGLGFPSGVQQTGRHVRDGFLKIEYDEVSEIDSAGQPLALTQFDGSGRLVAAIRFDRPVFATARLTGDAAAKMAQSRLAGTGVQFAGAAQADADQTGGWNVHWRRVVGGVVVRGDETSVHVWPDGRVQSVAYVEHQLAAAPATRISPSEARTRAGKQATEWFAGTGSGYTISGMVLQWAAPNAAFDAGRVDDGTAPHRLCWVANVKPTGRAADSLRLITLFIDAGDGSVIGGDVVE